MNRKLYLLGIFFALVLLSGCLNDAKIASHNLVKAADNFEIDRRIVFFNGITDNYLLEIEGNCAIFPNQMDKYLEVICKTGDKQYKKHFLGLSDNVAYFVEHLEPTGASAYHYRVTFKPQTIVPNIDFRGDLSDGPRRQQ